MKKTYNVGMNENGQGGKHHYQVAFTVQAESESEAQNLAQQRYPNKKVCFIEQK